MKTHNLLEEAPFKLAVNKYADMSEEEFEKMLHGINFPHGKPKEMKPLEPLNSKKFLLSDSAESDSLPENVNWFAAGKVSRAGDQ